MKQTLTKLLIVALILAPSVAGAKRLGSYGAELGSATAGVEFDSVNAAVATTTNPYSGTYAMSISGSIAAGAADSIASYVASSGIIYARYRLYIDSIDTADAGVVYFKVHDTALAVTPFDVQISAAAATPTMHIYYNDYASELANTASLALKTWYRIEVAYDSSKAAGSDMLSVRVDGTQVASSSALSFSSSTGYWEAGVYNQSAGAITGTKAYFDDIAINDTLGAYQTSWPGNGRIVHLQPNAAGDNSTGKIEGTNTGTTWGQVAEVTPDDATTRLMLNTAAGILDVNITTTTSAWDSATFPNVNLVSVGVRESASSAAAEGWHLRFKTQAAGTLALSATTTHNDVTYSTNGDANTTPKPYLLTASTSPQDGSALTATSLANAQIGIKGTDVNPYIRLTTLWLLVDYDGTTSTPALPAPVPKLLVNAGQMVVANGQLIIN